MMMGPVGGWVQFERCSAKYTTRVRRSKTGTVDEGLQ